eukprot:NODE_5555_length_501_cov_968.962389_g4149_i0.p2 GENE.NODE_5555_length_501_cov_968.962389_g4149_i0~~NODE_5555_length_501_cov_968.962389_g4149_i0.p2  ORF type:complete len:104 (-),score=34.79 NODE_5555_length_501_cov_968.962389_g4149_i0:189-464(-)
MGADNSTPAKSTTGSNDASDNGTNAAATGAPGFGKRVRKDICQSELNLCHVVCPKLARKHGKDAGDCTAACNKMHSDCLNTVHAMQYDWAA